MKSLFLLCCLILVKYQAVEAMPKMDAYGTRRCVNMWDEGCINGQLPGSGGDDDYLNGGFTPGKRCLNVWDEGCINGQINGAGGDDNYLGGGFTPGRRSLYELLAKLQRKHQLY